MIPICGTYGIHIRKLQFSADILLFGAGNIKFFLMNNHFNSLKKSRKNNSLFEVSNNISKETSYRYIVQHKILIVSKRLCNDV